MSEPVEQRPQEDSLLLMTAVLAGSLIAASQQHYDGFAELLGGYLYWIARVIAEAMMFVSVRYAVRRYLPEVESLIAVTFLAAALSLIPFVLVIIAADIMLGVSQLGLSPEGSIPSRLAAFGMEMIALADNHFILCALLTLPSTLVAFLKDSDGETLIDAGNLAEDTSDLKLKGSVDDAFIDAGFVAEDSSGTILSSIDPPLSKPILWAEAHEDHVRLVTSDGNRTVENRFSDILRELPSDAGIRVHRSHWVAFAGVSELFKDGQNLKLRLKTDDVIPVSQSYRTAAEVALSKVVT